MRQRLILVWLCFISVGVSHPAFPVTEPTTIKGKHFIVYYNSTRDFAQKVLSKAERDYQRIAKNLGYARFGDAYWTYENRCKLYVYGNRESYLNSRPGVPSWSGGYADYSARIIAGYYGSDKFLTTILPHEITHLVFGEFVGQGADVPKWFNEGVALAQEEGVREEFQSLVEEAIHRHYFIPIYLLTDETFKGVHTYDFTFLAYAESALITDFLISRFGGDRFIRLCRRLRDGMTFEESFEYAYRGMLKDFVDLEEKFIASFKTAPVSHITVL